MQSILLIFVHKIRRGQPPQEKVADAEVENKS